MWRTLLFLLCLAAGTRQLSITEFLVPAAIEVGEEAHLNCKYELLKNESEKALFIKWWWTPLNNTDGKRYPLYQRIAGQAAQIVHLLHHNIELLENDGIKLTNVTPEVSGFYECEVYNVDEVRQRNKLVVYSIGTGPSLNVSVTDDEEKTAVVMCEAFDVAPRPDIVISLNGETLELDGYTTELDDGFYEIYKNTTVPLNEADGKEFTCEMFFQDKDVPHAPYITSQMFAAPTVSTPEPEEPATEPSAASSQPNDNGSHKVGDSRILQTLFSLLTLLLHLHYCSK